MMKALPQKNIAAAFLFMMVCSASCKKAGELSDAIDHAVDDAITELLSVNAITEDLDRTSNLENYVDQVVLNNKLMSTSSIQIDLPQSIPYSFRRKKFTLSGSAWTPTTINYSGTISKSFFTNKNSSNTLKISIQANEPVVRVNGIIAASCSGSGTGTGTGTGTSSTLADKDVSGKAYKTAGFSFTLPSGYKTMKIRTTEKNNNYRNLADLFVRKGSAPFVAGPLPPTYQPKYAWTADYHEIGVNRDDRSVTISNPSSGTWYVALYGYNSDFDSQVIITATK
ncbi:MULTISPECIES: hypothetical protein [unclassified Mucilaginibacter]|uniref:hypothetical protein n=1 Tax=unclassified Mucilaginibacter TaxID=2617802 RepID=UPI002AC93B5A|nr:MULTISPECIES: hypothetical protein [unclassified Mucilaginibacter]MEB0260333.1 hypothetical protein [Mucilaginibacter sp. 10I4]MEB0279372.1 hypothetical protein [Mucilaginibacter sp. 10B2]MEB0300499.1 hypothetical protein [Mucilaginibacter sp. 5C4]WPX21745.1 hypothetical protein RHM67_10655 [Mucilaginibacter sp. 5C4]